MNPSSQADLVSPLVRDPEKPRGQRAPREQGLWLCGGLGSVLCERAQRGQVQGAGSLFLGPLGGQEGVPQPGYPGREVAARLGLPLAWQCLIGEAAATGFQWGHVAPVWYLQQPLPRASGATEPGPPVSRL